MVSVGTASIHVHDVDVIPTSKTVLLGGMHTQFVQGPNYILWINKICNCFELTVAKELLG
jgi:hypothetical protein